MQRSSTTDPNDERYGGVWDNEAAGDGDRRSARGSIGATRRAGRGAARGKSRRHAGPQGGDPVAAARERRRRRRAGARRGNALLLLAAGALSVILLAMIFDSQNGAIADYHRFQDRVEKNEVKFRALKSQHEVMQRRLASLQLDKGREQILIEKGYVRPGERILLFPPAPQEAPNEKTPANDLPSQAPPSGHLSSDSPAASPATWRRSVETLNGWWRSLHGRPREMTPSEATPREATPGKAASNEPVSPNAATSNSAITSNAAPD